MGIVCVCAYGGVVWYFWCFRFLCEFYFLYCIVMMSGWVLYTRFLVPGFSLCFRLC